MEEYITNWKIIDGGIYQTKLPKVLEFSFLINDMSSVTQDYAKHSGESEVKLKVLADASEVEVCPELVIKAWNHAVLQYPKAKSAIFNESKVFKEVSDNFYKDNTMANGMKRFETEEEATKWLRADN